ncbi:MAG: hypothetical protein HY514_02285 [Candidatus Aenigmarchaeota archaeon]|nr:hypothetical protein [Candidatus Aenigmarchaeota archaeon]
MINILEIPDQHFFVWDKERHESIGYSLLTIEELKKEPKKADTEKGRAALKEHITPVFGYRQAEKLWQEGLADIEEVLGEKKKQQKQLKQYLEGRFLAAARRAAKIYPRTFGEAERRRDAAFYPAARSGLMAITSAAGHELEWESLAGELADGKRLDSYLPQPFIKDVLAILPQALLFNKYRDELKSRLRSYGMANEQVAKIDRKLPHALDLALLDLAFLEEEQRQQVENLLEECAVREKDFLEEFDRLKTKLKLDEEQAGQLKDKLKKVVSGSTFRLAKAVQGLQYGRIDEGILSQRYRTQSSFIWLPLGAELSKLELKEHDIDHVHTRNARYMSEILTTYISGKQSIPQKLINYLQIEDASKWCQSKKTIPLLDPKLQPDSKTLGSYIGYFLFGHGSLNENTSFYSPRKKDREWFLDLLEQAGTLAREPAKSERYSRDVAARFGVVTKSERTSQRFYVPVQFATLAHYALEKFREQADPELAKAALFGLLSDRYYDKRNRRGGCVFLKPEYEDVIRSMAQLVGLSISEGCTHRNKLSVYVRNPECIGYNLHAAVHKSS